MSEQKSLKVRAPLRPLDLVVTLMIVVPWLAGIVLAQGFWQTTAALIPPYAWYLLTEHVMTITGFIAGCGA